MFAWRSNCCGYRVVWARLTSTESLETTRAPRVNLSGKQFGPRPRQLGGPTLFGTCYNRCGHRVVWARLTSTGSLETTRAPSRQFER